MNDLERRLKDALDADGAKAPLVSAPPDGLRRRVRGRQVARSAVVMLTVSAVALVSFAGLRAIDRGADDGRVAVEDPWAGYEVFDRTATVHSFSVTSPSDWYLVDQWSWARPIAADVPQDERVTPILMLSNTDRGLAASPCFDSAFALDQDEAVMTIALDSAYFWEHRGQADALPQAPASFGAGVHESEGPCGPGTYVSLAAEDLPFVAHFMFGTDVADETRETLVRSFETMTSPSAVIDATPIGTRRDHPSGAYVIAGGENATGLWTLELRPQTEPGYLTNVQLELTTVKGVGVTAGGPFTVNEDHPIEQAGGDPVIGAVVKEADGVELHLEEGTPTIPAQLVPLPPSMPFDFDLFFASNDADMAATAVPLGIADRDPSTTTDGRQIVAEGITGDTLWALEFSRIPGKNNLVLRDTRDGTILARLEPDSLDRVHTSGLEFVPEAIPGGSVVIFGVAAPAATHLAIALDHGSVTYLQTGDPRWDPLPILTSTGEPGLRLWWAELPIDVGEVVTFSETCDVLARKVFIPDHSVRRPFGDEEMDPRISCPRDS